MLYLTCVLTVIHQGIWLENCIHGYFRCTGNKINAVVMWLIFFPQLKHVVCDLFFVCISSWINWYCVSFQFSYSNTATNQKMPGMHWYIAWYLSVNTKYVTILRPVKEMWKFCCKPSNFSTEQLSRSKLWMNFCWKNLSFLVEDRNEH